MRYSKVCSYLSSNLYLQQLSFPVWVRDSGKGSAFAEQGNWLLGSWLLAWLVAWLLGYLLGCLLGSWLSHFKSLYA